MTVEQPALGQLLTGNERRDAIHFPIIPVIAAHEMKPGTHVGFISRKRVCCSCQHIGIIDPFLKENVKEGQWCYVLVYPNTITDLRHTWTLRELQRFQEKP